MESSSGWVTKHLEIPGNLCQEKEDNGRSYSCNERCTFEKTSVDTSRSVLKRPKTTVIKGKLSPSTLKKRQHDQRFTTLDSTTLNKCNGLLSVANLSLEDLKRRNDQMRVVRNVASSTITKKVKGTTAIADSSKIITKYDEAERRYIGTTIELIKKDHKRLNSGIAIWNKMPFHRLGYPNDKKRTVQMPLVDQKKQSHELNNSVAVKTYELQDRRFYAQVSNLKRSIAVGMPNSYGVTKTRSERVTKFLTDAFQANADILRLGTSPRPGENKTLSEVAKDTSKTSDQGRVKSEPRPTVASTLPDGTYNQIRLKGLKLRKVKISCIHFQTGDNKSSLKAVSFEQTNGICGACYKFQSDIKDLKIPQAPPSTPIRRRGYNTREMTLLGGSNKSTSHFRAHTR